VKYTKGYKYQLEEDKAYKLSTFLGGIECFNDWITMVGSGNIIFKKGYAWDGPSGPTIDTKNFMSGSLVHDGLYQLIREGKIPESYRKYADKELYDICRKSGMSYIRSQWVLAGVRLGGRFAAKAGNTKKVYEVP